MATRKGVSDNADSGSGAGPCQSFGQNHQFPRHRVWNTKEMFSKPRMAGSLYLVSWHPRQNIAIVIPSLPRTELYRHRLSAMSGHTHVRDWGCLGLNEVEDLLCQFHLHAATAGSFTRPGHNK